MLTRRTGTHQPPVGRDTVRQDTADLEHSQPPPSSFHPSFLPLSVLPSLDPLSLYKMYTSVTLIPSSRCSFLPSLSSTLPSLHLPLIHSLTHSLHVSLFLHLSPYTHLNESCQQKKHNVLGCQPGDNLTPVNRCKGYDDRWDRKNERE